MKVSGENAPPPISSFSDANLRPLLTDNLKRTRYDEPTPIQRYAIPIILKGRDLMATAQTGSGKTVSVQFSIDVRFFELFYHRRLKVIFLELLLFALELYITLKWFRSTIISECVKPN